MNARHVRLRAGLLDARSRAMNRVAALLVAGLLTGCAGGAAPDRPAPEPVTPELALAVFDSAWSRVHNTYYDTTFHGVDWVAVRDELRPVARDAGTADSLRAVVEEMLSRLGQSHFGVIPASVADALDPDSVTGSEGEPGAVGVELRVVDDRLVVFRTRPGGPADRAGVAPGWVVTRIGDTPVTELLAVLEAIDDDRRLAEARLARAASARLSGAVGDTVSAVFEAPGRSVPVRLVSEAMPGTPVRFGNLPTMFADVRHRSIPAGEGCVGLISFNVWMTAILPGFQEAFEALHECEGLILDLRGNPGGVAGMVMGTSGYFMEEQRPLGRLVTRHNTLNLVSMPRRVTPAGSPMEPYAGPLAILVDGQSMSTTELFAAGLQEVGRARIFGETSGGQALPALMVRLPNDDVLMHVFANLVTPDGVRIEGRGVIPDVEAPLDREALLDGRDPALDAAMRWIETEAAADAAAETHTEEQR